MAVHLGRHRVRSRGRADRGRAARAHGLVRGDGLRRPRARAVRHPLDSTHARGGDRIALRGPAYRAADHEGAEHRAAGPREFVRCVARCVELRTGLGAAGRPGARATGEAGRPRYQDGRRPRARGPSNGGRPEDRHHGVAGRPNRRRHGDRSGRDRRQSVRAGRGDAAGPGLREREAAGLRQGRQVERGDL